MAVQKSKKSRSRRGMRRSHHALDAVALTTNENGILHRRHHIAEDGTYRGKQIIAVKSQEEDESESN